MTALGNSLSETYGHTLSTITTLCNLSFTKPSFTMIILVIIALCTVSTCADNRRSRHPNQAKAYESASLDFNPMPNHLADQLLGNKCPRCKGIIQGIKGSRECGHVKYCHECFMAEIKKKQKAEPIEFLETRPDSPELSTMKSDKIESILPPIERLKDKNSCRGSVNSDSSSGSSGMFSSSPSSEANQSKNSPADASSSSLGSDEIVNKKRSTPSKTSHTLPQVPTYIPDVTHQNILDEIQTEPLPSKIKKDVGSRKSTVTPGYPKFGFNLDIPVPTELRKDHQTPGVTQNDSSSHNEVVAQAESNKDNIVEKVQVCPDDNNDTEKKSGSNSDFQAPVENKTEHDAFSETEREIIGQLDKYLRDQRLMDPTEASPDTQGVATHSKSKSEPRPYHSIQMRKFTIPSVDTNNIKEGEESWVCDSKIVPTHFVPGCSKRNAVTPIKPMSEKDGEITNVEAGEVDAENEEYEANEDLPGPQAPSIAALSFKDASKFVRRESIVLNGIDISSLTQPNADEIIAIKDNFLLLNDLVELLVEEPLSEKEKEKNKNIIATHFKGVIKSFRRDKEFMERHFGSDWNHDRTLQCNNLSAPQKYVAAWAKDLEERLNKLIQDPHNMQVYTEAAEEHERRSRTQRLIDWEHYFSR